MRIEFVEICNFRRLSATRVDLSPQRTIFVGANNSGKTSALVALRYFLLQQRAFSINDFTLSNWSAIDNLGYMWEQAPTNEVPPDWEAPAPFLDLWLNVGNNEVHYVQKLLPTLDWQGGSLGVRLQLEPKSSDTLRREYLTARNAAKAIQEASRPAVVPLAQQVQTASEVGGDAEVNRPSQGSDDPGAGITAWPERLTHFLQRRFRDLFEIRIYILDPAKRVSPLRGIAQPQALPDGSEALDGNPLNGLLKIDEITAQRGFGESAGKAGDAEETESSSHIGSRRLSEQLRAYYERHLDPSDNLDPSDLRALTAFDDARRSFDERLKLSFGAALKELEGLGYPGITDPMLKIATQVRPVDSMRHASAVQYVVPSAGPEGSEHKHLLPEGSNGLGFQNLISMIFRLMSFRDAWLRVGKAAKKGGAELDFVEPLHLVLVEEPEAHLHAQVQQVFVHRAYDVLRNHEHLRAGSQFSTQLIMSTHSSHIAHESDFRDLRYFRRLPASRPGAIPTSCVINLAEVFGDEDETQRFVTRYLKVTHCDLFFADGAILVEGPAERILIPHFVRERPEHKSLSQRYLTWLEIGGSHAHRLRNLLEALGVATLIITDLDSTNEANASAPPQRGQGQKSRNPTLKSWVPCCTGLDELLDKNPDEKIIRGENPYFGVRVAYQMPITVDYLGSTREALASTFEDALVFQNIALFRSLDHPGLIAKFKSAIETSVSIESLGARLLEALRSGTKAELALDLLELKDPHNLEIPLYINEGLHWLAQEICLQQSDVSATAPIPEVAT